MCGIAGIINPKLSSTEIINNMMEILTHRGPDDSGCITNENFHFGHRRLAIIDLEHGKQPMQSEDGRYTLIFNGEIYNYIELRQQLIQSGVSLKTFSDTEVLLNMLIKYGTKALNQLNGMFAFAFYDQREYRWLLARDHFGIKPLYYTEVDGQVVFASEIKALLLHPQVQRKVNVSSLQSYLTFQSYLDGECLFDNIYELPPAHYLRGQAETTSVRERYWHAEHELDTEHTESYFIDKLSYLLEDSVGMQTRCDVSLGAYLSGGLDSSIVSKLASRKLNRGIPLFHGKFTESEKFNESHYARVLAKSIHGELHEYVPTVNQFIDMMPKLIYSLDQPLAGPGVFPQFIVSNAAKEHVKVVLGGQGGDEIFAGYIRYLVGYLEQSIKGVIFETQTPEHLVTHESIFPNLPEMKEYIPLLQHFWKDGLFGPMDLRYFRLIDRSPHLLKLLTPEISEQFKSEVIVEKFQKIFNFPKTPSYINKMTYFDSNVILPTLLHVEDRVSMMASIESRVPLLDTRIMELLASIPPAIKFYGGKPKNLLKKAVANLLPQEIVERKDKKGFPVPLDIWMESPKLQSFIRETLLSKASRERGIFDANALENYVNQNKFTREMWGILSLELWFQQMIDNSHGHFSTY